MFARYSLYMRWWIFCVLAGITPCAQADPRPKVSDYPFHGGLRDYELGAEYMGRSFFVEDKAYDGGDFIAVEIGVYPRKGIEPKIMASQFALRFNGKKELIYAQSAGSVAVSMRLQPWDSTRRGVVIGAGPVIIGAPQRGPRFPGDRESTQPAPRPVPEPDHQANVEREPPPDYADLVNRAAFVEGPLPKPARGYLFFPYAGKLTKLKKIELVVVDENNRGSLAIK